MRSKHQDALQPNEVQLTSKIKYSAEINRVSVIRFTDERKILRNKSTPF